MKNLIALACIILLGSFTGTQNQEGTLSGVVIDNENGKTITNAKIVVFKTNRLITKTLTGKKGVFRIELNRGKYSIEVSANDYETKNLNIFIQTGKETKVRVQLEKSKNETLEIVEYEEEVLMLNVAPSKVYEKQARPIGMNAQASHFIYAEETHLAHNTEEYDVINENIFKDAATSPLSTFSVDVDKASYANVRRFLTQNQKPYKDAVRIEELINYFDYNYPQPTNGAPFSVTIEADKCPWNDYNKLAMIGIKGENLNETEIPPNNLVFLIDVSGSMGSANKLPLLKQAFKHLAEQLRPQDRIAIVVYASATGVVLESTSGNSKTKIISAINNLKAGGSTAGGAGIKLAYKIAKQNYIHGGNNRVILGTDGDFNVGISSTSELVDFLKSKSDDGMYLSILGFGMGNYKDGRMKQLSMAGNGNYAYIDNIMEAKKVFGTELWGTLYTIANDVKIQVEFNPAKVKAYRLIGYEKRIMNNEDFNDDKKDAGDIGCGHTVTAIYEIIPANNVFDASSVDPLKYSQVTHTKSNDLMTVKIRYKEPGEEDSQLISHAVEFDKTKSSSNLQFASAVAEFGMLLRDSEFKGSSSFTSILNRAKFSLNNDDFGYKADFIKMVEMAEMLYK
ncbi:MAG: von Willebrand factor type A domain-containing protein [Perlabentimonas sp.]